MGMSYLDDYPLYHSDVEYVMLPLKCFITNTNGAETSPPISDLSLFIQATDNFRFIGEVHMAS